ncbi:MAG: hypothetical protein QOE62_4308, partial [Actinomycetota bacterium]|nr:hypothetical protein [Actinomycetota bacterium]
MDGSALECEMQSWVVLQRVELHRVMEEVEELF